MALNLLLTFTMQSPAQSNPVGSLGGGWNVSPSGVATYSIPVEVIPGTNGMQPSLAITYCSTMGEGMMGIGWTVTGFSSITRIPQTMYYDNQVGTINYDTQDRFAVDGMRLIRLSSGTYAVQNGVYGTEVEDFTRYTLIGSPTSDTMHFVAVTDQGVVMDYGNTTGSRLKLSQGGTLSWMMNRITDGEGNYMHFAYQRNTTNGEVWPVQINYTGNDAAGLTAYAHVRFEYDTIHDANRIFVGGDKTMTTMLLSKMQVLYADSIVRQYVFSYTQDRSIRLNAVILQDGSGNELTRTSIGWNEDLAVPAFHTITGIGEGNVLFGDFNGDNIPDIFFYSRNNQLMNCWSLLPGNSQGQFGPASITGAVTGFVDFLVLDVDGDGKDEVGYVAPRISNSDLYDFNVIKFYSNYSFTSTIETNETAQILPGDYLGTGGIQTVKVSERNGDEKRVTLDCKNICFNVHKDSKLSITDVNGNGKSDIQVLKDNQLVVFEYNETSNSFANIVDTTYLPSDPTKEYFGDFNGDGNTDYIYYTYADNAGHWYLKLSDGKGYKPREALPFNTHHGNQTTPTFPLLISDVNGDGKDDIVQPTWTSGNPSLPITLNVYYSRGYSGNGWMYDTIQVRHNDITGPYEEYFRFFDIESDGRNELVYTGSIWDDPVVVRLPERREHGLVSSITDGFGAVSSVEFRYRDFPLIGCLGANGKRIHYPIASRLWQPDGLGGSRATTFAYGYAVFDQARRQLLGFELHNVYRDGMNTKTEFEYNQEYHCLNPAHTLAYQLGRNLDSPLGYVADSSYWNPGRYFFHREIVKTPCFLDLGFGRFLPFDTATSVIDRLGNTIETVFSQLDATGRPVVTTTLHRMAELVNSDYPWISRDSTVIAYANVTLPNGRTAVKPSTVTTWNRRKGYPQMPWRRTSYTYSQGRMASCAVADNDGAIDSVVYTYNALGLPLSETHVLPGMAPRTTSFVYDTKGRFVLGTTDPLGHSRSTTYDKYTGLMTSETDANGLTTSYQYDAFGRPTAILAPDGTQRNFRYRWNTLTTLAHAVWFSSETSAGTPETRTYYDILGRVVHTYRANEGYNDIVYDTVGRVVMQTCVPYNAPTSHQEGKTWQRTAYDVYGRVVSERAPYTALDYSYYEFSPTGPHDYYVTVTDSIRDTQRTRYYDALGRLKSAVDEGGTVGYTYVYVTDNGRIRDRMTVTVGDATTVVTSDLRGNRLSIQDPDAGTVTSTYDAAGRLATRTDALNRQASYAYDILGRTVLEAYAQGTERDTVTYIYDTAPGKGVGQLAVVRHNGTDERVYAYDTLGRLSLFRVIDRQVEYDHLYSYNALGQLRYLTYPDGFRVEHLYNGYGDLQRVIDASDNSLVYAIDTRNAFRQPLKCKLGNNTGVQYTYNSLGMLTGIRNGEINYGGGNINGGGNAVNGGNIGGGETPEVTYTVGDEYRDLTYTYNPRGFIATKADAKVSQSEAYLYDELDRLVSYSVNAVTAATFTYSDNGNIRVNSNVGEYAYDDAGPHAVTEVGPSSGRGMAPTVCDVTYNLRNKPSELSEGSYGIAIDYGADGRRLHTRFTNGQTLLKEKTRISSLFELEETPAGVRRLDYIHADGNIVAVHVDDGDDEDVYYPLTDHLGSWEKVMDGSKAVVQQTHFDPWGNRMSYTAWNTPQTQTTFFFDRGFTGHEHYDRFKTINANARLYDPVVGRFFSPDPFVQIPDFTQSYNRYSYCMNNPVMYNDPDGDLFVIDDLIAAAAIGAIINCFTQIVAGNVNSVGDFFLAAGIGALSGAMGLAVGNGVNAVIAGNSFASGFVGTASVSSTGFWAGAGTGAASGLTSGFITGTGNSLLAHNDFSQSLINGLKEGGFGLGTGAIIGGMYGGMNAMINNKHFWTGKPPYYEASLDNYSLVYQSDDMNCKNAILESIEKMNGGMRTQDDFKKLGDIYLKNHPEATLEQYFEYFGFTVKDPAGRGYKSLGNLMKSGCPTVIEENIGGGHTMTICKIRRWTQSSIIYVWLADPARGVWKTSWNTIVDPNFNHGLYTFILSL